MTRGADAGEQLIEDEGLGQVVVGAGIQAGDAIGGRVAGGQHEDGGLEIALAQLAAQGDAVLAREHPIQDDQLACHQKRGIGLFRGVRDRHLEAFLLQAPGQQAGRFLIVFY